VIATSKRLSSYFPKSGLGRSKHHAVRVGTGVNCADAYYRELHCFPKAGRDNTPWQLDKLIRLSAIRFFWTQWRKQPIEFVPDDFWKSPGLWPVGEKFLFPFRGARDRITSFEVIGSVDLHPAMAFSLAQTFPNLVELTIRSSRVWCGMCNNSEPVETAKSGPKHIKYQNSSGLPVRVFSSANLSR